MIREGYSYKAALILTGESAPFHLTKTGNSEIYTLNDGSHAIIKFSKYFPGNNAYWYGITPGQISLFEQYPVEFYFFITGYMGVLKIPTQLLQTYLKTCNTSIKKDKPNEIRHYHVMIQYDTGRVFFRNGPEITEYLFCDNDSDSVMESELQEKPLHNILKEVQNFVELPDTFVLVEGEKKIRRESRAQKYRIARIENFTCQVCGFRESYIDGQGKTKYIYEVDHIKNKALGYGESIDNLWVLCPNCHEKKTRGIIVIDVEKRQITERGKPIIISDSHLFKNG